MQFVRVPLSEAEVVRQVLLTAGALDTTVRVITEDDYIFFPVSKPIDDYDIVDRAPIQHRRKQGLGDALSGTLSAEQLQQLTKSYDIVGTIAILDIDESLKPFAQVIAQAVMETHSHVKTVLTKAEKHGGEFRTQQLAYVVGEDTRETLMHESGTRILVDVEQVYFSVRLSTERLRIAAQVKPGESVLVMFSGAAPYVVILAKKTAAARVVGVEKNPVGHEYGLQNLKLNKIKNAVLYNADCADLSFLTERFDRIIMPLPASSLDFLAAALSVAKDKAIAHLYVFAQEDELTALTADIVSRCEQQGYRTRVADVVRAGHHAPYVYRWCFDLVLDRL
jgi:tRNA (guanine37-N1)-methyltransferase